MLKEFGNVSEVFMANRRPARDNSTLSMPMVKPKLLLDTPQPIFNTRIFHRTPVPVIEGRIRLRDIQGWVENERTSVMVKEFEHDHGRKPNNAEMYKLLLRYDTEFKIKELARNIAHNGVRVPIILDEDGTLLDGNRRYFASLHLLQTNEEQAENYSTINAMVLPHGVDEDAKRKIIVEMNFVDDGKIEWSSYVRASLVYREWEELQDYKKLAERFGWTVGKIKETIETMGIVQEFIAFHSEKADEGDEHKRLGDAMRAELKAAEHYVLFWEARNKFAERLHADIEFKEWFFEAMAFDAIKGITQVRPLADCWQDQQARGELFKTNKVGVQTAIAIVQAKQRGVIVEGVEDLDESVKREKVEKKIRDFTKWLGTISIDVLKSMSTDTLVGLREGMEAVIEAHDAIAEEPAEANNGG